MVSVCLPSDALWQHLPSYLGFSYPGRGVSLHGCSSKAQPLLLTLDEGYLIQKRCPFHYKGLECKSRKSRNTWSNRQIWPWNTEWSRAKANWVLPKECTGHTKHPLPTTQEKTLHMDITRWSTLKLDWLYSLQAKMEKLYTSAKTRPGDDCGSDHELLIAKLGLKKWKRRMKKLS